MKRVTHVMSRLRGAKEARVVSSIKSLQPGKPGLSTRHARGPLVQPKTRGPVVYKSVVYEAVVYESVDELPDPDEPLILPIGPDAPVVITPDVNRSCEDTEEENSDA